MAYTIHLVEDERNLNQVLSSYLEKEGWNVHSFLQGEPALQAIERRPHLWILDIMLPDVDGFHLLRKIKELTPEVPVIFISARDADLDRVIGLEMGSDDYLAKPFLPRELVIRSKKLLDRVYRSAEGLGNAVRYLPPYRIDPATRSVHEKDNSLELTSKEFDLLYYFIENTGQAVAREQILVQVWGEDYFGSDRVVDDLIRRLRKKMPELKLETMYGYGYRLVKL